jgi:deoxyribose-phosphate aldolase
MNLPNDLAARIEASLLSPEITPDEARRRLKAWTALGVRQVVAPPFILQEVDLQGYPELAFTGAVSFPAGFSTLASKRMELLECLRLGARAATVVLTPAHVADRKASLLEKEMNALATTAPELQLRFLVDVGRFGEEALTVLLRLIKSVKPAFLVAADGVYSKAADAEAIRWLRERLPRKVRLEAGAAVRSRALALSYLEAGAELVMTDSPGLLLEPSP